MDIDVDGGGDGEETDRLLRRLRERVAHGDRRVDEDAAPWQAPPCAPSLAAWLERWLDDRAAPPMGAA